MKKSILLVRVSTERQSFDEQEKQLYNLAISDGYEPNNIIAIAEKESGIKLTEEERRGLSRMKESIANDSEIDCVYAWEVSRISRRKKVLFSILEFLQERKIQLVILSPSIRMLNPDGTINESGEIVFTLFSQISESEMRNKQARFKRTRQAHKAQGLFTGGVAPIGYKVENKRMVVDEETAPIVRDIFSMYISGRHSVRSLAREFVANGKLKVSADQAVRKLNIITRNPIYKGGIGASKCNFPAIVSEETWNKAQQIRIDNMSLPKKVGKDVYLGKHLLRCPMCGRLFTISKCSNIYRCTNLICRHLSGFNFNIVDNALWLTAIQFYLDDWQTNAPKHKEQLEKSIEETKTKIQIADEERESILASIDRLEERIILGKVSPEKGDELEEVLKKQLKDVSKQKNSYINQLDELNNRLLSAGKEKISMNRLLQITDMKVRDDMVKEYISKATLIRLKVTPSFAKLEMNDKYGNVTNLYLHTRRGIIYNEIFHEGDKIEEFTPNIPKSKFILTDKIEVMHEPRKISKKVEEYRKKFQKDNPELYAAHARDYRRRKRELAKLEAEEQEV